MRIVLDAGLRIPRRAKLVKTARSVPTLVATTRTGLRKRAGHADWLRASGCEVVALPGRRGRVDLDAFLDEIGRREMTNVMVEGGGQVLGSFFDQGLADEALVFIAPKLIGGRDTPTAVEGDGIQAMEEALQVEDLQIERSGRDILLTGYVRYGKD